MPEPRRRTPRAVRGPRRPRRPGQRAAARRVAPRRVPPAEPPVRRRAAAAGVRAGVRPRLTGRAAVLVLVLAVLTGQLRLLAAAYLQQRQHIAELKAQIAQREADIDGLEREKGRWRDPAYVQSQARERFGYVMPGETSYVVLGEDGKPLESETALLPTRRTCWSRSRRPGGRPPGTRCELAGNPPNPRTSPTRWPRSTCRPTRSDA